MVRPRLDVTVSLKAFDIVINGMNNRESPLFRRIVSRSVDFIITDWETRGELIKKYQDKASEYSETIARLKAEIKNLKEDKENG